LQLKVYESPVNSGIVGQKIDSARSCIFPQTLQIFDRILTESCKFSTEKIMGGQHLTFPLKFLQNGGF